MRPPAAPRLQRSGRASIRRMGEQGKDLENAADGAPASRISKEIPRSIMIWPRRQAFDPPAARRQGGTPPITAGSFLAARF